MADEQIFTLRLRRILGEEWEMGIILDAKKPIKDTMGYWRDLKAKLNSLPE
jgi:hypothetical protein